MTPHILEAKIESTPVVSLRPYAGNARTHSRAQIRQIAASIERFGFTNPVLLSDDNEILAGHGRVEAAKHLGMTVVPALRLTHLTEVERRAYALADNKLALNAGWDGELLAIEMKTLIDLDFDMSATGFSLAEIDFIIDGEREKATVPTQAEDAVPLRPTCAVSRSGDLWCLGRHRLLCGDARSRDDLAILMQGDTADLLFVDPPYNVAIDGNVCGLGNVKHREFAFASGERMFPLRCISCGVWIHAFQPSIGFRWSVYGSALMKAPTGATRWSGPYLKSADGLVDPWGRPYQYRNSGRQGDVDVFTLGRDNIDGGDGEDRDVTSW